MKGEIEEKIMKIMNISNKNVQDITKFLSEEKFIWIVYDNKTNDKNILFGDKIEKEKMLYNIFEIINKKESCSMNSFLCRSLLDKKEIIIIKIIIEYFKNYKASFEFILKEIDKEITEVFKLNPSYKNNSNIIIQIDDNIFSYKESFIKEELDKYNIKSEKNYSPTKIKNLKEIEGTKIGKDENDKEIQELQKRLNDSLSINNDLKNKIAQLEKELKNEKNKNKISEEKILNLEKQLENEKKMLWLLKKYLKTY